jgi:hypothetical protein
MNELKISLDDELFRKASRLARLENLSIEDLVASTLRRHVEHAEAAADSGMAPFSLENYELQRDAGESDEDYGFRKSLFQ